MSIRCTKWKHVISNDKAMCDCKTVIIVPTADKNSQTVRVLTELVSE